MNDADLVRESLAGDSDAFTELVNRWAARVMAICHARLRRADLADDLTQETFLRAFRSLRTLSDPQRFGPWISGIAVRACLDWLKSPKNGQVHFSTLGPGLPEPSSREDAFLSGEDRRMILHHVEALPENYRQVVMLFYYEDLTYRQAAEILGVSTATINVRLTQAREILRHQLVGLSGESKP